MLRKLKLYGDLAEVTGHKEFDVQVTSIAQAVSFLINNFPQLENYMANKYYKILVDKNSQNVPNKDNSKNTTKNEIFDRQSVSE